MEPLVVEKFADNGAHSHWELMDRHTGVTLCFDIEALIHPDDQDRAESVADLNHHVINSAINLRILAQSYMEAAIESKVVEQCNRIIDVVRRFTKCRRLTDKMLSRNLFL